MLLFAKSHVGLKSLVTYALLGAKAKEKCCCLQVQDGAVIFAVRKLGNLLLHIITLCTLVITTTKHTHSSYESYEALKPRKHLIAGQFERELTKHILCFKHLAL